MTRSNKYLALTVIFSTAITLTGCLANKNNQNPSNTYNNPNSQPANNYGNAGLPLFNFSCPTGIDVHGDDQGGSIYINGKQAYVKKFNDNYYEASDSGISISINRNPDGSLAASYTRQGGANGICQAQNYNNPPPNTGYNNNQNPNYNQNQGYNNAAKPVPGQTPAALNDFVGAKAGQAEGDLVRRGYVLRKSAGLNSFWEETASGGCVSIVTNNGRYQSLVYTAPEACR
jgi:hypothetical protein